MSLGRVLLWVVTLTALAVALRATFIDVVPGVYAGAVLLLLLLVYVLGVFYPRLEMFGSITQIVEPTGVSSTGASPQPSAFCEFRGALPSAATLLELGATARARGRLLTLVLTPSQLASSVPSPQVNEDWLRTFATQGNDVALALSTTQLCLCLVYFGAVLRYVNTCRTHLGQSGCALRYLVLPSHFAPSGCFAVATRARLAVLVASRRHTLPLTTGTETALPRVINLEGFPNVPSTEEVQRWLSAAG